MAQPSGHLRLWRHERGIYVRFTPAGAEMFCLMAAAGAAGALYRLE